MAQGKEYRPSDADRLFVERAVMAGTTVQNIAAALNIHDDTLRKHYRFEIVTARERLKGEAVRVLMDNLTDGSLDAAKYVLSRVAGWTERQAIEHTGADGGPVQIEQVQRDADEFASRVLRLAAARGLAPGDGEPEPGDKGGA